MTEFSAEAVELLLKDMRIDGAVAVKSDREIAGLLRVLWDHATIATATGAVLHQAINRLWRANGGPLTDEDEDRVLDSMEAEVGPAPPTVGRAQPAGADGDPQGASGPTR